MIINSSVPERHKSLIIAQINFPICQRTGVTLRITLLWQCLLAVRSLLPALDPSISETWKYGVPCFCYKKFFFCYLWTDKKTAEPYILMAEGRLLHHPGLNSGDRTRMKIFSMDAAGDLPIQTIHAILTEGLSL
jgi:hypothetical protein